MNNSQSSLLNLASLAQDPEYNTQDSTNNTGSNTPAATQNNMSNLNGASNTGSNFSNTPRAMQGLSLPQLNYNGGTASASASASAQPSNPGTETNNTPVNVLMQQSQRQNFLQYGNASGSLSSSSLQRMNMPGLDLPLVSGSPSGQGAPQSAVHKSNLNFPSQASANPLHVRPDLNGSLEPTSKTLPNGGFATNSGASSAAKNSANALLGMQMPMILNSGSDSTHTNLSSSSASQRMMNMKSDLSDLPLTQQQDPAATPASLLHNSAALATSSLPTITILNDGEHVNPEGDLIGKSGKPLRNTKRAAQNRNAQRAFRQRREKYVKDLECKARDYNRLLAELETYKNENRLLKSQLAQLQQRANL